MFTKKKIDLSKTDPYMNRMVAGGKAFSNTVLDRLLCRAYFNNHVISVLELLATPPSSDCDDDDGANVLQLLPLWGQQQAKGSTPDTYGELFSALLREQRLLSLGLYRRRGAVEYVLTNPPKETRLDKRDRVYVVGKLPKAVDGDRGYNVPRRARTLPASMLSAMTDTQRHSM